MRVRCFTRCAGCITYGGIKHIFLSIPIPIDSEIYDKIAPMVSDILCETNNININIKNIDKLLYKYYDLTDAEIKVIEESV